MENKETTNSKFNTIILLIIFMYGSYHFTKDIITIAFTLYDAFTNKKEKSEELEDCIEEE